MARVNMIVADSDITYIKSISNFIRTSDFSAQLAMKYFDNETDLGTYLQSQSKVNVLLVTPDLIPEQVSNIDTIIVLTENQAESYQQFQALQKYQPLTMLFTNALDYFYKQNETIKQTRVSSGDTKVVSVYSPIGGSGKTTVAVNLARSIAQQGQKVFYLNLELVSSLPLFFPTEGIEDSSEVFYYSKAKPEQLEAKLSSLIRQDDHRVDYFNIPTRPEEIYDTAEKDIEIMLSSLVRTGNYDVVLVDLDSSLNQCVLASLKKSNVTLWPLTPDVQSFHKTKAALASYKQILQDDDLEFKVAFLLNKFLGKKNMPTELEHYDLDISFQLPYVSEWKSVGNAETLTSHSFFNDQIGKLYEQIIEQDRGVPID